MIVVLDQSGNLVKTITHVSDEVYGFHPWFGFVSEKVSLERIEKRRRTGFSWKNSHWLFQFKISLEKLTRGELFIEPLAHCQVEALDGGVWKVLSGLQEYRLCFVNDTAHLGLWTKERLGIQPPQKKDRSLEKATGLVLALFLLFFLFNPAQKIEELKEEKVEEPVVVKIVRPKEAVVIPSQIAKNLTKEALQDKKVHRAVQQELGFLGLVGRKNLKDAVGGAPTALKDASAGAGAGGSEGSGGELLVGLGQGVKRVTVGNSGTAGLGGIGTKGRGGGLGGYGDTRIASGEGKGLTSIPLSNDMVLEGGLDRAVIQATIARYLNQVKNCYEQGLKKNPGLGGLVSVAFEISPKGSLSSAQVAKSSLGDINVEGCITERMMNWQFPKPMGEVSVKVSYPFLLKPSKT